MNNLVVENLISSLPILLAVLVSMIISNFYQKSRIRKDYSGKIYLKKISRFKVFL